MRKAAGKKRFQKNRIILFILAAALVVAVFPAYAQETPEQTPAAANEPVSGTPEPQGAQEQTSTSVPSGNPVETPEQSALPATPKETTEPSQGTEQPVASASASLPQDTQDPEAAAGQQEEPAAEPLSIITEGLAANEVMVDNFTDLKNVLEDYSTYAGVDTIYLNGDITYLAGGITINTNRNAVTIIGHPKGQSGRHTITDIAGGQGAVIRIQKNNFNLTVKDVVINSKNFYGTFTVPDAYTGVTTSYVNVTYTGPQITYNRRGIARYIDSSITIAATGGDPAQEVAELAQLEIGGNTTFTNTAGATSMFWFAGNDGSNQYLRVLDGANVTVTHNSASSPYGFIYVEGSGGTANQKPEITIGSNASLSVATRVGFTHIGHRIESVNIKEGGTLRISQLSDPGDYPTIYVNSSISVLVGGTLEVQRGANTRSNGLIRFYNTGGQFILNNPKRIQLYNPYGRVITTRTGTAAISGTVGAVNVWTADNGYTDSIDNMPANIWNKNDSSAMSLSATLGTAAVTAASISNKAEGDPFTAEFNSTTFNTYAMPMLAAGSYFLDTDNIYPNDAQITGTATGNAAVKVSYTNNGAPQTLLATADGSGAYYVSVPDTPLAQDTAVLAVSHKNYLKARHTAKVLEQPSILHFLSVPKSLSFHTGQVPALPQIVGRQDENWTISVEDTRGSGSAWRVDASIVQPLTGTDGTYQYSLPGALVYVDGTGTPYALGNTPLTVYSGTTGEAAQTDINWTADRGLLVSLKGGQGYPGVRYTTTVEWSLIDAP